MKSQKVGRRSASTTNVAVKSIVGAAESTAFLCLTLGLNKVIEKYLILHFTLFHYCLSLFISFKIRDSEINERRGKNSVCDSKQICKESYLE